MSRSNLSSRQSDRGGPHHSRRSAEGADPSTSSLDDGAAREDVLMALKELDSVVQALIHQHDLTRAVHFSLRALDIRRRFFGLGHFSFEEARIHTSFLIVESSRVHQANDRFKETAELLAHVDRMTEHALPNVPELASLDRSRRLARLAMMKELLIARYRQGRHRSALTFGRHVLELARETMCLYELPTLHLNIASVHSSLGQHKEALRHCYLSFQKICLILESLEEPERYPFAEAALSLELIDKEGVAQHAHGFEVFMKCCSLAANEMSEEVDMDSVAPSFKAPSSSTEHDTMEPERRRWGGALALAFRNMAAEQEHLMMLDGALLTYKVAHTTALSCLGPVHPVSQQCEQALRDAEGAAKARAVSTANGSMMSQQKKSAAKERSHIDSFLHRGRGGGVGGGSRTGMSSMSSPKVQHHNERPSSTPVNVRGTHGDDTAAKRGATANTRRPAWNDYYNSDLPVPMHHEERMLASMNASRQHSRQQQRLRPLSSMSSGEFNHVEGSHSVDVSAISHVDKTSRYQDGGNDADVEHHHNVAGYARSTSPLPPRPATTSFGELSGYPSKSAAANRNPHQQQRDEFPAAKRPLRGNPQQAGYEDMFAADLRYQQYQQQLQQPISLEDFSFLQNTFKLRYDINFNRPNWRHGAGTASSRVIARRERKELGVLKDERRAADALAAELGIGS